MTVLFVGSELECFLDSTGGTATEVTTAGYFEAAYSRCAVKCSTTAITDTLTATFSSASSDIWTHAYVRSPQAAGTSNRVWWQWYSGATPVFRAIFLTVNSLVCSFQYRTGSVWTTIGTTFTAISGATYTFDFHILGGSSGVFEFYVGGVLTSSGTASMTSVVNMSSMTIHSAAATATNVTYVSQVAVKTDSTLDCHVYTLPPTGNGSYTAWTGSYLDIDEVPLSDTDFIAGNTNGDKETVVNSAITPITGVIEAVVVSGRSRRGATGPQNMKIMLRKGGTDYASSTISQTASFAPYQTIWENDPSTGAAWTSGDAFSTSLEYGYEAVT